MRVRVLLLMMVSSALASLAVRADAQSDGGTNCQSPFAAGLSAQRPVPAGRELLSAQWSPGPTQGPSMSLQDTRALLDSAIPLAPCDPSIAAFHYAPGAEATLQLTGQRTFRLRTYLGQRARLIFPDGAQLMIDYGEQFGWIDASFRPYLQRAWREDASCREHPQQPHAVRFQPSAPNVDTRTAITLLQRRCTRVGMDTAMNIRDWCCP